MIDLSGHRQHVAIQFDIAPEQRITISDSHVSVVSAAREEQHLWAQVPLEERLTHLRRFRHLLADNIESIGDATAGVRNCSTAEALTSEVLPLLAACKFLERNAATVLRPRRLGRLGRPVWLFGTTGEILREPLGVVLLIAPSNYPLLLAGVQLLQSVVAGNAVVLKPGRGGSLVDRALVRLLTQAGFPAGIVKVLDESIDAARSAILEVPDKVLLTGSSETGEKVGELIGPRLIPATMELGGCDPVLVGADADISLAANALAFALRLNKGNTCIAPKRVFVHSRVAHELESRLLALLRGDVDLQAVTLVTFEDDFEALRRANDSPFALGASIFTRDETLARFLAGQLHAGVVTINEIIIPTADPRLPFGGHKRSGYGVTRGAEGLLELTRPKIITLTRGRHRPAHQPEQPGDSALFATFARLTHGSFVVRCRAFASLFHNLLHRRNQMASRT